VCLCTRWLQTVRKGDREIHHNRKALWSLLTLPAIVFVVACFAFSAPAHAAQTVPYKMNFQGRLTNASGITLTGTHEMQFNLYTAVTGGTYVWGETRTTANGNAVTVTSGLFSVLIGEGTAVAGSSATLQAAITANSTLYIEIIVGAETLTPRSQFGASAYAINADMIDGIDGASLAQLATGNAFTNTNSITTSNASAFVVNSGSSNIFKVDTTGTAQVVVGTTDANGTILVLDTKNDNSTDPTGANGGMYYNSSLGKFRCYQAGAWTDCITAADTLQTVYAASGSPAAITTTSAAKTILFKAGATYDAAALFDIQNAAGTSLFTVDSTTNSRVYIGDSTADSTGTVLVLDTKDTTGDPTGVDGAMYYNAVDKNFKCYKNGLWSDCNFASLRSEWVLQEDFLDAGVATATIGTYEWTLTDTSTATEAKVNAGTNASNYDRWGIYQTTTAATIGSGNYIRLDPNGMAGTPSNMTVEFDHGPSNAAAADGTQSTIRIGLMTGTTTSADPTDGIYFQYLTTTAAGNWFRCTQNNNAVTCTDTGVARTLTLNVYQRFKFVTNAAGTAVEFFIDEVSVGTNTTNLPASARSYGPAISMHTASATARAWKMDYYQIKRNLTTLR